MRLLVATDHRFLRLPDGCVFVAQPSVAKYALWQPYTEVFEEVVILARVRDWDGPLPPSARADGPGISFCPLPEYSGPGGYLRRLGSLKELVKAAVHNSDAYIFRVPGSIGFLAWKEVKRLGRSYGVQVIGDPWDLLAPGTGTGMLRPLARWVWTRNVRQLCREASAVAYVTREALQRAYPPDKHAFTTYFSNVELRGGWIDRTGLESRTRRIQQLSSIQSQKGGAIRLGTIGTLARLYKGPDVLLRAFARCRERGLNIHLDLVGDGVYQSKLEALSTDLGIGESAHFLGALPPGQAIYSFLDGLDLFVLASRQEGLPRAMIEAMARGCPCIGTEVGGIPELLPPEDLVPPNNIEALARKIVEVLSDPGRMERMARRNWENAREYLPETLAKRRREFYQKVREFAEVPKAVVVQHS